MDRKRIDIKKFSYDLLARHCKYCACAMQTGLHEKFAGYRKAWTLICFKEWLERKRISFTHEGNLSAIFYEREILDCIFSAFDSAKKVYFMLKEAL